MTFDRKYIEKFHYITCDTINHSHSDLAIKAINSGCKWVQIRIKNKDKYFIKNEVLKVKKYINENNLIDTKLILNDYVDIAYDVQVDGVHLGKNDMSPQEARKILGKNFIIGATANTFEDIVNLANFEIDYIGLGPYRFTTTKEKLEKILGLEGYKEIMNKIKYSNIQIPIIAIGGIKYEDLEKIINTGIHGVAVSSYITFSDNFENTIKQFLQFFKN